MISFIYQNYFFDYDSAFDCLGSTAEIMEELGYCDSDIIDRRKHEKFLCDKCRLIESVCCQRNLNLWTH